MDTSAQPSIAHQFLAGEARNFSNRAEHGHGVEHADTRQLHQQGHLSLPCWTRTQLCQNLLSILDLGRYPLNGLEAMLNA